VDLRQLRFFVAVVEERGFRKASRELYVAQPSVSRALSQLEQELGVELLRRGAGGVAPSDAGLEFLGYARGILREADQAKAAMRARATPRLGIRIGAIAGLLGASELTAPIFEDYRTAYPELQADFSELSLCDQVGPLLAGQLDVAIVRGPLSDPEIEIVPLAREQRVLMLGAHHDMADETTVSVDDVLDQPTLPLGSPDGWSAFWQLDDLRGGPNLQEGMTPAATVQAMQLAVASAHSVITVPDGMSRLAPNPLVRYVGLPDAPPSTIGVARRRGDQRQVVTDFIDQAVCTAEVRIEMLQGGALTS
jgi:DNA-binding transcriptional LysR family regulator